MLSHLEALYSFYGEMKGVRVARKHLGWYCRLHPEVGHLPAGLLTTECAKEQWGLTREFLSGLIGSNGTRSLTDKDEAEIGDQLAMTAKHRALTSRRPHFTVPSTDTPAKYRCATTPSRRSAPISTA